MHQAETLSLTSLLKPQKRFVFGAFIMMVLAVVAVLYLGQGVRVLIDEGFEGGLFKSLLGLFFAVILLSFSSAGRAYAVAHLGEYLSKTLQEKLFYTYTQMNARLLLSEPFEHWQKNLNHDIPFITSTFTQNIPAFTRNALLCIGGLINLLFINTHLSLILLGFLPLILITLLLFLKGIKTQKQAFQTSEHKVTTFLNERVRHMFFIQASNLQDRSFAFLKNLLSARKDYSHSYITKRAFFVGLTFLLSFGAVIAFLGIGATFVLNGTLSKGDLTGFIFYAVLMAISASSLSEHYGDISKARGLFNTLIELLKTPYEETIDENALKTNPSGDIVFQDVSFSYEPAFQSVLSNLNATIKEGSKTALIGESGAGKSTLFKLILGFYTPTSGSILWGNTFLHKMDLKSLRSAIAYVPQDPVIFEGSLYDNLTLWQEDVSEKTLLNALEQARALDIFEKLGGTFNSILGTKGVDLSRGEKQRIALARVFLQNPKLLLLDEPTSSLDPLNEKYITEALHTLMQGKTTLMITHRLETTKDFDDVWTMEKGKFKKRS